MERICNIRRYSWRNFTEAENIIVEGNNALDILICIMISNIVFKVINRMEEFQ